MMKSLNLTLLALIAVYWAGAAEGGQAPQPGRQKVDVAKLGPQAGQRVPDFSLKDQTGRMRNLESIMGPRGAMLVFFRSADW